MGCCHGAEGLLTSCLDGDDDRLPQVLAGVRDCLASGLAHFEALRSRWCMAIYTTLTHVMDGLWYREDKVRLTRKKHGGETLRLPASDLFMCRGPGAPSMNSVNNIEQQCRPDHCLMPSKKCTMTDKLEMHQSATQNYPIPIAYGLNHQHHPSFPYPLDSACHHD